MRLAITLCLRGAFPLGEAAIATDVEYSMQYVADCLKYGRFELGEPVIATVASFASIYSEYVLGGRFRLAEDTLRHSEYWDTYKMLNGITS